MATKAKNILEASLDGFQAKQIGAHITERIHALRTHLLNLVPQISSERVRLYTRSYQETETDVPIVRRAKALRTMLRNMSISFLDGELFAGTTCRYPRGVELFPEYEVEWIERELEGKPYQFDERPGDRYTITGKTRQELSEFLPYWHGRTHSERVKSMLPEETRNACAMGVIDSYWLFEGGEGHITVDYKKLLEIGLEGIIHEIQYALPHLDLTEPKNIATKFFYEAALISLDAIVEYAERCANAARDEALCHKDPERIRELERISDICHRVPRLPASGFYEALQSIWFIQAILQIETNGHSVSLGRLDQTLYPYFRADFKSGALSASEAAKLLQGFWLKLFTVNKIRDWDSTHFFLGYQVFQNITIGGQLYGGRDAANELSYMMLGVQQAIRLTAPSLSFRYFDGTSEEFLQAAVDVIKGGGGQPALYSDECIIPSLINRGIAYEDALNWSVVGCVEPIVEGKQSNRPNGASFVNVLKIMEMTLHGGRDPKTGYTLLPIEKDLTSFSSFEELRENWKKQVRFWISQQIILDTIIDIALEEMSADPLVSCLVDDCIKRGKTIKQGGAVYDFCGPLLVGLANTGDSLVAIERLVFKEKVLTGKQVLHALDTDFADDSTNPGGKEIRRLLLAAPKYGNDDDYADSFAAGVLDLFCQELPKYKTTRNGRGPIGGIWHASCSTVSANIPFGLTVGATPDGRKAGTPTSDTTSPTQGMDRKGPLRTMKSVAKLPNLLCSGGNLFNLKFSPLVLEDEVGRQKFSFLVRTFLGDLKGMHVQFNVVDGKLLREAKAHPEEHPDLMVRVAGYSALFTTLDPKLQDDIINRTEHSID